MESSDSEELDEAIEAAIDRFEYDLDDDDRFEKASGLANVIARSADSLDGYVPEFLELPADWDDLSALAADDSLRILVLRLLQTKLARRYCTNTIGMAERCLELTTEVVPGGPRTARYVALLARSYIAGFHPETIILAGSVLEDELADAFQRADIPPPETATGKSSIPQQIDFAHAAGWLTRDGREAAKSVWHRRCKIVHEDPTLVATAADTVRATISVLRQLCVVGLERDEAMLAEVQRLGLPPEALEPMQEQLEVRRRHKRRMRKDRPK